MLLEDDIALVASAPEPVKGGTAQTVGVPGKQSFCYWVVAHYPIGTTVGGPFFVRDAPDSLNFAQYVIVVWEAALGATSYDVLRTVEPEFPSAPGNYAVTLGVTGTSAQDRGNALLPFDPTGLPWGAPVRCHIHLNNRDFTRPTLQIPCGQVYVPQLIFPDGSIQNSAGGGGGVGPPGPQGAQGPAGAAGAPGPAGPTGATGPTGPQGSQGNRGVTGPAGATGATGAVGPTGAGGPQGATGATGPQGATGAAGTAGAAGPRGLQGPVGPQGPPGTAVVFKGTVPTASALPPTGNTGDAYLAQDTGHLWVWDGTQWVDAGPIQGPVGPEGPQGPAGLTGAQGVQGPPGPTGPTGATGPSGPAGPTGPQGTQGPTGTAGVQGAIGPEGPAGQQGPVGPTGAQGSPGPEGPTGPTGMQGVTGLQGPPGVQGPPGSAVTILGSVPTENDLPQTGNTLNDAYITADSGHLWIWDGTRWVDAGPVQGPVGPAGPQGPQGSQGSIGPQGPEGPAGPAGATGPQGPAGAQGAQGPVGGLGPAGPQGMQGQTGAQGPAGNPGPAGAIGATGPTGTQGPPGAQGVQGATGAPGPQGAAGAQGPVGAIGPAGPQGVPGPQGPSGSAVAIKGSVPTSADLPATGNQLNDAWITEDTGHLWVWNGSTWIDAGQIQGPVGPAGPPGATGPQGPMGATGAAGPTGPTGATGPQGPQGPQGPVGGAESYYVNGNLVGSEPALNLSAGTNTTITGVDNSSAGRIDITINSLQSPWTSDINGAGFRLLNPARIGILNSNPGYPLDVTGDVQITGALGVGTGPYAPFGKVSIFGNSSVGSTLSLKDSSTYGPYMAIDANFQIGKSFSTGPTANGSCYVYTNDDFIIMGQTSKHSFHMKWATGYVGVLNNNAQYPLDVAGDVNISAGSVYRINGVPIATSQTPWLQNINAATFTLSSVSHIGVGVAADASIPILIAGSASVSESGLVMTQTATANRSMAVFTNSGNDHMDVGVCGSTFAITNLQRNSFISITNDLAFLSAAGLTERMRLTAAGNLGIGTSLPIRRLHVGSVPAGNGIAVSGVGPNISLTNADTEPNSNTQQLVIAMATATGHYGLPNSGDILFGSQGTARGDIHINANYSGGGAAKSVILQEVGGYVGIGIASPVRTLHVNSASTDTAVHITTSATASAVVNTVRGSQQWSFGAGIAGDNNWNLWNATNPNFVLTASTAGNVGIGNVAPSCKLTITPVSNPSSWWDLQLRLCESGSNPSYGGFLGYSVLQGNWVGMFQSVANNVGSNLVLNPYGGNVGINQQAPVYALDVSGIAACTVLNGQAQSSGSACLGVHQDLGFPASQPLTSLTFGYNSTTNQLIIWYMRSDGVSKSAFIQFS